QGGVMTKTRSATGCLAADTSRHGVAVLARLVAVCSTVTVLVAGANGCSGSSSNNSDGTGGRGSGGGLVGSGGASAGTSGASAGSGGASAGSGAVAAGTGGVSAGSGGASASTGGASASTGGASASTGGAVAAGAGGVSASTGGVSASTGGVSVGTGGVSVGTGGVSVGTGGVSAGTAGVAGSGGGSAGDASVPVELSGYDVEVDPYGTSPLVAVVNLHGIEANEVQSVQVVVTGQDGGQDFVRTYSPTDTDWVVNMDTSDLTFPEAGYHVPVLGLYADRENVVRILVDVLDRGRVDLTLKINTSLSKPDEDAWVPSIQVQTAVADLMEPGWTVAEISIEPNPNPPIVFVDWTRTIAFDERGAIRWALRMDLPKGETFTLRRSATGNFLTGSFDTIVEVTKLGRIIRTFQLSDYTLNHEIVQIGSEDDGQGVPGGTGGEHSGNILVLASNNGASTIQDHILELDSDSGELLDAWDLTQVFDPTRRTYIDAEKWDISQNGDWLHDNGLAYCQADESIIVSGRHQGVAKIRRDGTLVWLLAPHKGWNEPQSAKLLTAVSATSEPYADSVQLGDQAAGTASTPEFDWPFGQHSPSLLPNGDLLLFDNGASRHFSGFCGSFSRAVIYRVDEAAMTVRQIGQFVFSKSESSCYCSNTHQLPVTGNILIQPGLTSSTTAVAKEVTTQVADDGTISFDQVVFEATLSLVVDKSRWYVYSYRGHRWTF
ncbi:MAG: aryl-sulfate sulfotransferase, partial [Polyangiaceae bacterium]|nr:aryl-sulfate sulfotransferase [Polyangiaceae bacterium]